ncbi:hypothetical protein ICW40_20585, partial [Actinotalea ferrariae]|nr:hypothetical protein [Actinotalea ferrariae]
MTVSSLPVAAPAPSRPRADARAESRQDADAFARTLDDAARRDTARTDA